MKSHEWLIVIALLLGASLNIAMSQETKPEPPTRIAIQSDLDRYHYQTLITKYQLDEQQISNLVLQFLNSNETAKSLRSHQSELMNELNPLRKKLFDDHKLDSTLYTIEGDPPEFVLIKK